MYESTGGVSMLLSGYYCFFKSLVHLCKTSANVLLCFAVSLGFVCEMVMHVDGCSGRTLAPSGEHSLLFTKVQME